MLTDINLWIAMFRRALSVALVRYFLIAGPAFLLGYVVLARWLERRRIQSRAVTTGQLVREIGSSVIASIIFAMIDVAVTLLSLAGVMQLRVFEPAPPNLAFLAQLAILLVLHDTYFYWTHRLFHWGPLYRLVHEFHHRSINPTPFAAFAFHPVEAVVLYAFVPLVAFAFPIPIMPLFVFGLIMTATNVYGHSGIELLPKSFMRLPLARFLLTATHHDLHHSAVDYNFGFYSSCWDRVMGTNHPAYEEEFARAAAGRRQRTRASASTASFKGASEADTP